MGLHRGLATWCFEMGAWLLTSKSGKNVCVSVSSHTLTYIQYDASVCVCMYLCMYIRPHEPQPRCEKSHTALSDSTTYLHIFKIGAIADDSGLGDGFPTSLKLDS